MTMEEIKEINDREDQLRNKYYENRARDAKTR